MKRRIVFALISVLICVGAAVWLVPYTPMPDTAEIVDVLVLHVHAGDTAEDITGQVDTNAVCEAAAANQSAPSAELSSWHQRRLLSDSGGIRR